MTEVITSETILSTDLIAVIAGLRRALRRRVGPAAGVSALTDAQRELVRAVRLNPESRIGDLAQLLHLAPNTVSTLVGTLVSLGWLDREQDPEDARSARIRLSEKGAASVAQWRDRRETLLATFLEGLPSPHRAAIERALPSLQVLIDRLEEPS